MDRHFGACYSDAFAELDSRPKRKSNSDRNRFRISNHHPGTVRNSFPFTQRHPYRCFSERKSIAPADKGFPA